MCTQPEGQTRRSLRDLVFGSLSEAGLVDLATITPRSPYLLPLPCVWPLPRNFAWRFWIHGAPQETLTALGIDPFQQSQIQSLAPSALDEKLYHLWELMGERFNLGNAYGVSYQRETLPEGLSSAILQRFLEFVYDQLAILDADRIRDLLEGDLCIKLRIPSHFQLQNEIGVRGKNILLQILSLGGVLIPQQISSIRTFHEDQEFVSCNFSSTVVGTEHYFNHDKRYKHDKVISLPKHTLAYAWGMRYVMAHRCNVNPASDDAVNTVTKISKWLRTLPDTERRLARHIILSPGSNGSFAYLSDPYWAYQVTGITICSNAFTRSSATDMASFRKQIIRSMAIITESLPNIEIIAITQIVSDAVKDILSALSSRHSKPETGSGQIVVPKRLDSPESKPTKPSSSPNSWCESAESLVQNCEVPGTKVQGSWYESAGSLVRKCKVPGTELQGSWYESAGSLVRNCTVPGTKVQGLWYESARLFTANFNNICFEHLQAVPEVFTEGTTESWLKDPTPDLSASQPAVVENSGKAKKLLSAEQQVRERIGEPAWEALRAIPTRGASAISASQVLAALETTPLQPEEIRLMALGISHRAGQGGMKAVPPKLAMACLRGTSPATPWVEAGKAVRTPIVQSGCDLAPEVQPSPKTIWQPSDCDGNGEHERVWEAIRTNLQASLQPMVFDSFVARVIPISFTNGILSLSFHGLDLFYFDFISDEFDTAVSGVKNQFGLKTLNYQYIGGERSNY